MCLQYILYSFRVWRLIVPISKTISTLSVVLCRVWVQWTHDTRHCFLGREFLWCEWCDKNTLSNRRTKMNLSFAFMCYAYTLLFKQQWCGGYVRGFKICLFCSFFFRTLQEKNYEKWVQSRVSVSSFNHCVCILFLQCFGLQNGRKVAEDKPRISRHRMQRKRFGGVRMQVEHHTRNGRQMEKRRQSTLKKTFAIVIINSA